MIIYPPGQGPTTIASENAGIRRYFEDIAALRCRGGQATTAQDEAQRFADTFKPSASMLERLRSLKLIDPVKPAHLQAQGVRQ